MKKHVMINGLLALAALFLLQGCINENWIDNVGKPVVFTAVSGYDNGPSTRTAYSGVDNDESYSGYTKKYERIDWIENDRIRIYSVEARTPSNGVFADYKVVNATANGKYSEAEITNLTNDSHGLQWGEGVNRFFSLYPAPSTPGVPGSPTIVAGNFEVSLPATQTLTYQTTTGIYQPDMKTAYMWAATSAQSTQTEPVELAFHPAVTAFQFTVGSPKAMTFYGFELSSTSQALSGIVVGEINSSFDGCNYTCPSWSAANSKITVTFNGTTGIAVPAGDSLKFTVFAMPQDLTNMTAKFITDQGTKKLALNENVGGTWQPYVFDACKKYRITNLAVPCDEDWQYIIEEIPDIILYGHNDASQSFKVKSYMVSDLDATTKVPMKWKIQYKDALGNWTDLGTGTVTGNDNSTFSFNNSTGNGVNNSTYAAGEGRTAYITGDNPNHGWADGTSEPASEVARHNLRTRTPLPSSTSDAGDGFFDLSKHPVYGTIDGPEQLQETANSYVVTAPGNYKFPLVYGNARSKGADNKAAYWPAAATTRPVTHPADPILGAIDYLSDINAKYNTDNFVNHYYLPQFYNAYNQVISSPYILTDLGLSASSVNAIILWQDMDYADDPAIIPYDNAHVGVTSNGYIWFNVPVETIRPGNLVIAVRRNSDNLILWSWHIWITDKDLTPGDNLRGIDLMPFNLGFVEGSDGAVDKYTDRSRLFRAVGYTTEGGTDTERVFEEFNVIQKGDAKEFAPSIGSNPYYQWGRKDPIIPSLPGGGSRWIVPYSNPSDPNDKYSDLPAAGPGAPSIAMDILPASLTANYAASINKPYKPMFNSATTSWVGGPVYPFSRGFVPNRLDGNPFTYGQLIVVCNARLAINGLVATGGSWINQYVSGDVHDPNSYIYFLDHYNPDIYNNPLSFNELQSLFFDTTNHFRPQDFDSVPGSTAAQRSASAVAYNLWNNFIYSDNVNTNTANNKIKTIYDPCPPGFTVPVRYMFVGNTWPLTWKPSQTGTPIHRENDNPMAGLSPVVSVDRTTSTKGVFYDGVFFPYTGGRVLVYTDLTAQEQGRGAYYWSDNPFNMQGTNAPAGDPDAIGYPANPTNIGDHWFYQFALILSTNKGSSTITSSLDKAWSFTKGSAAAIRPMVDPAY